MRIGSRILFFPPQSRRRPLFVQTLLLLLQGRHIRHFLEGLSVFVAWFSLFDCVSLSLPLPPSLSLHVSKPLTASQFASPDHFSQYESISHYPSNEQLSEALEDPLCLSEELFHEPKATRSSTSQSLRNRIAELSKITQYVPTLPLPFLFLIASSP